MDDLLKDAARRERGARRPERRRRSRFSKPTRSRAFDVDERSLDYVVEVIQHYATSLRHGHRHAYESLPRMLTLWFDVGAAAAAAAAAAASAASAEKHAGAGAKNAKSRRRRPTR